MLVLFLFGLFLGSFLGVVVDRISRNETIIKGRSYCESCKKELAWYDLIPVFSFLSTKGKCRYCGAKLSLFYPIIEVSTGILFVLTYFFVISNFPFGLAQGGQFQISNEIANLLYYLFIVSSFIVIFFTDLKYGIIPDKILFLAVLVSILYLLIISPSTIIINLLSGLISFVFFLTVSYLFFVITKKQSMGGGDIKLSFLLGLFLGFPNIIICLYLAFLTGAFVSIILILWRKKSFLKDTLPFGPFLIAGAILSLFFGNITYSRLLMFLGI